MVPVVAALLKIGLPLVANAFLAKGSDWVKEKTGVDVAAALGTEEGRLKLREAELQHEAVLMENRYKEDLLGVELEKLAAEDRDSARKREADIATSAAAPLLNKVVTPILAFGVTGGFFIVFGYLIEAGLGGKEISQGLRDVLMTMLGSLGTVWIMVMTYYFGSSSSSAQKSLTIDRMSKSEK